MKESVSYGTNRYKFAGMYKMETVEGLDSHGILHSNTQNEPIGFPSITKHEHNKKCALLQRNKTFASRVPPPGHEYDFRRTPDAGRASPKKYINGQIRPCIPADTPVDIERLHLNESPTLSRYRAKERLDFNRCPTPMPMDSEYNKHMEPSAPQPTARSAWDRTNVDTADVENLADEYDNFDLQTPRYPVFKIKDRTGRRFKPATQNNYDIIMSDVDHENFNETPTPNSPLNLTENVLNYYTQRPVNKDRRIAKWLVDCQEKSRNQLPAHLPNIISASKRMNGAVSFEDI